MTRLPPALLFTLLLAAAPGHAVGLPDTGQDTCYNDTGAAAASVAGDGGSHPRQDCRYGRDAAAAAGVLTKIGGGAKGFDYTKIANNGAALAAGATLGTAASAWACTRDNITGLTWEVKTAGSTDLRFYGHTYTWYNSDSSTNAGIAGNQGSNTCNATLPGNLCNTQAFVTAVNNAALCSYTNWRLPTLRELRTLVYYNGSSPNIDSTYFPNTQASFFWSGSSLVWNPSGQGAWGVGFDDGKSSAPSKPGYYYVRLVRGGQF